MRRAEVSINPQYRNVFVFPRVRCFASSVLGLRSFGHAAPRSSERLVYLAGGELGVMGGDLGANIVAEERVRTRSRVGHGFT